MLKHKLPSSYVFLWYRIYQSYIRSSLHSTCKNGVLKVCSTQFFVSLFCHCDSFIDYLTKSYFILQVLCLQKVPLNPKLVVIMHALFCQLNELHSLEFMPIRLGLHTSTYSLCLSTQSTSIFMVPRSDFALIHFWAPQVEGIKDARREVLTLTTGLK